MPNSRVIKRRKERRMKIRDEIKANIIKMYNDNNLVASYENLCKGFYSCKRGVGWKPSIQKFELEMFYRITEIINNFYALNTEPILFHKFQINERGKARNIQSVNIDERDFQHSLCDNVLEPCLVRSLIYDNASSLKNKGTDFSVGRVKRDLKKFYRWNGYSNNGYIILIDLHDYFNSISHLKLESMLDNLFTSKEIKTSIFRIIDSFEGETGLGLGSQVCQFLAIFYLNRIDHYIKEVMRIKYYGRYMDDSRIIVPKTEDPYEIIDKIKDLYSLIDIELNMKKTKVIDLSNSSFIWLKKRYRLTNSGKVIIKENKKNGKTLINKNRKFLELYNDNVITLEYIDQVFRSCIGSLKRYSSPLYVKHIQDICIKNFPELYDENFNVKIDFQKLNEKSFNVMKFVKQDYDICKEI